MPTKSQSGPPGALDSLSEFLEFLAKDMREHPNRLKPVDELLLKRAEMLTADVEIDLDQPLLPE